MEHLRTYRTSTKTFHNNRRTEASQDQHGQEKHGSRPKKQTRSPAPLLPKAPTAIPTPKASAIKAMAQQQQPQGQQPTGSAVRHREQKPVEQPVVQPQPKKQQVYPGKAVPGPKDTPATTDYCIKEGQFNNQTNIRSERIQD